MELIIRPMDLSDLRPVEALADQLIGAGFYTQDSLEGFLALSKLHGKTYSYVLSSPDNKQLFGFRLACPPGTWVDKIGYKNSKHLWPVPEDQVALFKSIFINEEIRGLGYGAKLAQHTLNELKELHPKAAVTYCWKESPNNSSFKYLSRLGFQKVDEHPNFWKHIDYLCVGCKVNPCTCTAIEMIKLL